MDQRRIRVSSLSALITVVVVAPLMANYYFSVIGAGCNQYFGGFVGTVNCSVTGVCNSPMEQHTASEGGIALCSTIASYMDAQSWGGASSINASAHSIRADSIYSWDADTMCQCDNGCTYWDQGTNPFPC
jgi:hypothetical protein